MLHKIGVELGFKKYLLLSLQVENQTILDIDRGRATPSFFEDAFEAFIGAILVDFDVQGYIYADRFVRSIIENVIDFAEIISKNDNFKDSLQRFFQMMKKSNPVYTTLQEDGPLYRKVFTRMITINKEHFLEMDQIVQKNIKLYTSTLLDEYKLKNNNIYLKLYDICKENYILGIGFGKKIIIAEQDTARVSLLNLNLDLNF